MPTVGERSQNVQIMRNFTTGIAIENIYGKQMNPASGAITSSESGWPT